jgi:hypothetical protein
LQPILRPSGVGSSDAQGRDDVCATFEFRIPIMPQAPFFSNVKLAALSLAKLGGKYATVPLKVSVGDHVEEGALPAANLWSADYPVVWRPTPDEMWPGGIASGMDRYAYGAECDVVILMDADACLIRPIDELLRRLREAERPTVAGVTAHFPPFQDRSTSEARWRELLAADGRSDARLEFTYSVASAEEAGHCPPYFNYGFVAFNAAAFDRVRLLIPVYTEWMIELLDGTQEIFFTGQIALTLSILEAGLEVISLGSEYNCINSDEMLGNGLANLADIRVMHYLRTEVFNRHTFLCRRKAFDTFRTMSFASPVVQLFQRHVLSLPNVFYDEPHD